MILGGGGACQWWSNYGPQDYLMRSMGTDRNINLLILSGIWPFAYVDNHFFALYLNLSEK